VAAAGWQASEYHLLGTIGQDGTIASSAVLFLLEHPASEDMAAAYKSRLRLGLVLATFVF
jgi:hypothetical protein